MTYEVTVEAGKIREFARATHAEHPRYSGADAVIPPTFLATRVFSRPTDVDPLEGIRLEQSRTLHVGEEFRFHGRVPKAGETFTVASRVSREWHKEGRRGGALRFVELVTEFRDADGELVAEAVSTVVETSRAPESE